MARRSSGRKTDYAWGTFGDAAAGVAMPGTGTFGGSGLTSSQPLTITRVRGRVGAYLDAGAADESVMLLVGLVVVSADAFAAGAAPEIFNDAADDEASWLWQGALWLHSGVSAVAGSEVGQFASVEIDSKAMRRNKPNDVLAFVHQAPTELVVDQAGTYDVTYFVHCLKGT